MASVSRSSKHLREQETSDGIFSSVAAHDAHTLTAAQVPTCARGEHTQQHVTLVLCGGDVVGKLWTGKAQSRKALSVHCAWSRQISHWRARRASAAHEVAMIAA